MGTLDTQDPHGWTRRRLGAWRAGLLEAHESERVEAHLADCADCRALAGAFAAEPDADAGEHVAASLIAEWPRARETLRGLERALVRRHLERCAACRQDLESLGHEPRLEYVPALEPARIGESPAAGPAPADTPSPLATPGEAGMGGSFLRPRRTVRAEVARVVRFEPAAGRPAWRDRALIAWASVASAAAVLLLFVDLRPSGPVLGPGAPIWSTGTSASGEGSGLSLRLAPQPRSLKGPAKGEGLGRLNVIPVMGPLSTLALGIKPLDVPDTSLVTLSLLDARGDTLYAMRYRQWELRPNRLLLIDGEDATLSPGQYALVLASGFARAGEAIARSSRYRFELREK